jgi:uncharacterized protein YndB with AHSA1/START domain
MITFLGWIALLLAAGIGGLVAYAATRPDRFHVARTLTVPAPPDLVFALINDLHGFNRWNPYERKDPGKGTYAGAVAGVGASYAWNSAKVGTGAMTITEALAPKRVVMRLDFEKPFKAQNRAIFSIVPRDVGAGAPGSDVTWAMEGPAPLLTRVVDLVIGLDRMIGRDFEDGLRNLAALWNQP